MIIGIIGKVGSGKTVCTKYIERNYNAVSFICDDIAKEMLDKGDIDYADMDMTNFFIDEKMQEFVRITVHPKVFSRIFENINIFCTQNGTSAQIFLIETALPSDDFIKACDKVIYIENSYEKKLELLKEHRSYNEEKVKMVLKSQKYYEKYYEMANYKIFNDGTKEDMCKKVKEVMDEICIICK